MTQTEKSKKYCELARSFPCIRIFEAAGKLKLNPGEPVYENVAAIQKLMDDGHNIGSGAFHTCEFLICVFNYRRFMFNVFDALNRWDSQHHEAFLKWVKEPWTL